MESARKLVLLIGDDLEFVDEAMTALSGHRALYARSLGVGREVVSDGEVSLVLFGPSYATPERMALAGELKQAFPETAVAVCARLASNRVLRAALHARLDDVLDLPLQADDLHRLLGPEAAVVSVVIEPDPGATPVPLRAVGTVPPTDPESRPSAAAEFWFPPVADEFDPAAEEAWSGERERPVA